MSCCGSTVKPAEKKIPSKREYLIYDENTGKPTGQNLTVKTKKIDTANAITNKP